MPWKYQTGKNMHESVFAKHNKKSNQLLLRNGIFIIKTKKTVIANNSRSTLATVTEEINEACNFAACISKPKFIKTMKYAAILVAKT
jgi:hypothetical protein